jgi:lactoylglutathione lyase
MLRTASEWGEPDDPGAPPSVAARKRNATARSYEVVGSVPETAIGHLTMLKLPDDDFVTVELVHDPTAAVERVTGFSHFVIKVESMAATLDGLAAQGIEPVAPGQEGEEGFRTAFVVDPDGYRIELVQWPAGHPEGITAADWPQTATEEGDTHG